MAQVESTLAMQALAPKLKSIQAKFAGDQVSTSKHGTGKLNGSKKKRHHQAEEGNQSASMEEEVSSTVLLFLL